MHVLLRQLHSRFISIAHGAPAGGVRAVAGFLLPFARKSGDLGSSQDLPRHTRGAVSDARMRPESTPGGDKSTLPFAQVRVALLYDGDWS